MIRFLQFLFWQFGRFVLRLRYRVRVEYEKQCQEPFSDEHVAAGQDPGPKTVPGAVSRLRGITGPTLVMPNHPAYIDPPLVLSPSAPRRAVRPVVTASMYRMPMLYPFMRLVEALEVPDLTEQSRDARERTLAMIDAVVAGLQRGESFLLYPSGRASGGAVEVVGAARAAAEILERCPQANVVLVRTRGVWGSMFSYARTGKAPSLGRCLLRGAGLAGGQPVFFAPRRDVTMTVEVHRSPRPARARAAKSSTATWKSGTTAAARRRRSSSPITACSARASSSSPTWRAGRAGRPEQDQAGHDPGGQRDDRGALGPPAGRARRSGPRPRSSRSAWTAWTAWTSPWRSRTASASTADRVADTLGELWALADGQLTGSGDAGARAPPAWERPPRGRTARPRSWPRRWPRPSSAAPWSIPDDVAVADQLSGVLTYRRLLVGARLMARRFGRLPGDAVGVLLPASVAADIAFFALHLAGKLPVLLNWTTGPGQPGPRRRRRSASAAWSRRAS